MWRIPMGSTCMTYLCWSRKRHNSIWTYHRDDTTPVSRLHPSSSSSIYNGTRTCTYMCPPFHLWPRRGATGEARSGIISPQKQPRFNKSIEHGTLQKSSARTVELAIEKVYVARILPRSCYRWTRDKSPTSRSRRGSRDFNSFRFNLRLIGIECVK